MDTAVESQHTAPYSLPTDQPKEEPEPEYTFHVSPDNMTAYLRIKPAYPAQEISCGQILSFLEKNRITYGICEEDIRSFCQEKKFYSELICAKGNPPEDQKDGFLTYSFNTESNLKPKVREDGTVDFRDLGLVRNVAKGDLLCSITPPEGGKDGKDIFGNTVPLMAGRMPELPVGTNTAVSEDKLSLFAEIDGCIEFLKSRININDVFMVRGNVDSASGNVSANGSVVIQGDVKQGFIVTSGQDITVRGLVEGATLEANGSISLSHGMNGMGRGLLKAGGNIVGKYFENTSLECENDIYADTLLNCRVTAGGSILLKGSSASLIGGSYQVGRRVAVKNIGTAGNAMTRVAIQSKTLTGLFVDDKDGEKSIHTLEEKLAKAQAELDTFEEGYELLKAQFSRDGNENGGGALFKSAILKKTKLSEAVESAKAEIRAYQEKVSKLIDYHILGTGVIYPGTKLVIGLYTLNVSSEYSSTKFYADQERIVFGPILPSDLA